MGPQACSKSQAWPIADHSFSTTTTTSTLTKTTQPPSLQGVTGTQSQTLWEMTGISTDPENAGGYHVISLGHWNSETSILGKNYPNLGQKMGVPPCVCQGLTGELSLKSIPTALPRHHVPQFTSGQLSSHTMAAGPAVPHPGHEEPPVQEEDKVKSQACAAPPVMRINCHHPQWKVWKNFVHQSRPSLLP
jgi:hypothetical protein